MRFGYMMNSEGCRPDNYSGTFGNDEFRVFVMGTENQEVAYEAVRIMVEENKIDALDLCEDFQDARKFDLIEKMNLTIPVKNAKFSPKQRAKLEDELNWYKFGVLILGPGLDPEKDFVHLKNDACDLHVFGVSTVEQACEWAKKMRLEDDFECYGCSSTFGEEGTEKLVEALESTGKPYLLESSALNIVYED